MVSNASLKNQSFMATYKKEEDDEEKAKQLLSAGCCNIIIQKKKKKTKPTKEAKISNLAEIVVKGENIQFSSFLLYFYNNTTFMLKTSFIIVLLAWPVFNLWF